MSDAKPEEKNSGRESKAEQKAKGKQNGIARYLVETKAELKKIVWPTPKQIVNHSAVVLFFMVVIGVFIWLLDTLSTKGFTALISLLTK